MHFVSMAALHLQDGETGKKLDIKYHLDTTIASLIVVLIFCYTGIRIAFQDKVFSSDITDAIENFMEEANKMSMQEMRAKTTGKKYFYLKTLFQRMEYLIGGGIVTGSGVVVMHYLGWKMTYLTHPNPNCKHG
jgi:NO-binding membrane sensor protein with MHYT domain